MSIQTVCDYYLFNCREIPITSIATTLSQSDKIGFFVKMTSCLAIQAVSLIAILVYDSKSLSKKQEARQILNSDECDVKKYIKAKSAAEKYNWMWLGSVGFFGVSTLTAATLAFKILPYV